MMRSIAAGCQGMNTGNVDLVSDRDGPLQRTPATPSPRQWGEAISIHGSVDAEPLSHS
jgi:hypothetical protein